MNPGGPADADLSRATSHALRHEPWLYELEPDEQGWVPVEQLLDALRDRGGGWSGLARADLDRMVAQSSKQRHELAGERIRARYGHSLPGRVVRTPAQPPPALFHGTSPQTWERIRDAGLRPMARQYVHLSVDVAMATAVGRRKHPQPVVLSVDAAAAGAAGVPFYRGNDQVRLADGVPARFLTPAGAATGRAGGPADG